MTPLPVPDVTVTVADAPPLGPVMVGERIDVERFFRERVRTVRVWVREDYPVYASIRHAFENFVLDHYVGPIAELTFVLGRHEAILISQSQVPAREERRVISIRGEWTIGYGSARGDELRSMVRKLLHFAIREVTRHELDECLYDNGRRAFDPHGKTETPKESR